MCVAIAKPRGVALPDGNALDNCQWSNRDGAGVAWEDGSGKVHIKKDFVSQSELKAWLEANITKSMACLIHFRLATSGGVKDAMRHPFPLSINPEELKATEIDTDIALIHNGVLWTLPAKEDMSDTAVLVRDILGNPTIKDKIRSNKAIQQLIGGMIGESNKLALLWPDGHILTFGEFVTAKGVQYSNGQYKTVVYYDSRERQADYYEGESFGFGANKSKLDGARDLIESWKRNNKRDSLKGINLEYCCYCYIQFSIKHMYLIDYKRDLRACRKCYALNGKSIKNEVEELTACDICGDRFVDDEICTVTSGNDGQYTSIICLSCETAHKFGHP